MGNVLLWLVGNEQFHHHLAGLHFARLVGGHNHPFGWLTNTAGRQRPLPLNRDHTGAAVAV